MSLEIRAAALDSPEAVALDDGLQQEYMIRYGGIDATPVTPAEFAPPGGVFLVGWLDGVPVAGGGFRTVTDGAVEIKKMYVEPDARGRGFARRLLAALEARAAARGCREVILETGSVQPEAYALYISRGYRAIPAFGIYSAEPGPATWARCSCPTAGQWPGCPDEPDRG